MNSDELYHFGVKGMKWGVRRYQNPDGTRTELGKRRERKGWKTAAKVAAGVAGVAALGEAVNRRKSKLSDEQKEFLFARSQSEGKDKPNTSRVEKASKDFTTTARSIGKVSSRISSKKAAQRDFERREELRRAASRMSDEELRTRINRMNLEKQYVDLSSYGTNSSARWSAQDKMDLGLDAIEALASVGGLAMTIWGIKKGLRI